MNTDNQSNLRDRLERLAGQMGARFFGVADLTPARTFIEAQGGAFPARYSRALSVGIAMRDGIVDELPRHREVPVARTYDYLYDTVNASLNRIALRLGTAVDDSGFARLLIPASQTLDTAKGLGLFSHKLAARLAGLGWIGPSCLLITPELGPRVRWVTVFTDAPLEAGRPIDSRCGDCRQCVEACPPRAFTGRPFAPEEPREMRFDIQRCMDYRSHLEAKVTGARVCGMCVYVCPYGQADGEAQH